MGLEIWECGVEQLKLDTCVLAVIKSKSSTSSRRRLVGVMRELFAYGFGQSFSFSIADNEFILKLFFLEYSNPANV